MAYGKANFKRVHCINLSQDSNLEEAAQNLYDSLIRLDNMNLNTIYCLKFPETGLGVTLNERLNKAANKIEHTSTK